MSRSAEALLGWILATFIAVGLGYIGALWATCQGVC